MITDIGEYIVGAYLKLILNCDFIDYNVRPPGGGLKGLEELDVLGLNFEKNTAFLCEVTTHISGLTRKQGRSNTIDRIIKKHKRQKTYARQYLNQFRNVRFMYWSPVVHRGVMTKGLEKIEGLELFINGSTRSVSKN